MNVFLFFPIPNAKRGSDNPQPPATWAGPQNQWQNHWQPPGLRATHGGYSRTWMDGRVWKGGRWTLETAILIGRMMINFGISMARQTQTDPNLLSCWKIQEPVAEISHGFACKCTIHQSHQSHYLQLFVGIAGFKAWLSPGEEKACCGISKYQSCSSKSTADVETSSKQLLSLLIRFQHISTRCWVWIKSLDQILMSWMEQSNTMYGTTPSSHHPIPQPPDWGEAQGRVSTKSECIIQPGGSRIATSETQSRDNIATPKKDRKAKSNLQIDDCSIYLGGSAFSVCALFLVFYTSCGCRWPIGWHSCETA